MWELSSEGQEKLFALLHTAFDIYNAFSPGKQGERELLKLRDEFLRRRRQLGDGTDGSMTITLPVELVGYMMAASKHMGDMCMAISEMGKQGILFAAPDREERTKCQQPRWPRL